MSGRVHLSLAAAVATALGLSAVVPLFADLGWLPACLLGIAVVTGGAALARYLALPRFAEPVLALLALAGYLTVAFGKDTGWLGVLPDRETLRVFADELTTAGLDIRRLAAPVPVRPGLLLLTVLAVSAVALLVDLLAVTMRRAALAGLPLLALFVVPGAIIPGGIGWLPFAVGSAGWLALLLTEGRERVQRWGHAVGSAAVPGRRLKVATSSWPGGRNRAETAPLTAAGRRIGFAAIGIAVLAPLAVPGLAGNAFGGGAGEGFGFGSGSRSITTYNPLVALKGQLSRPEPVELMALQTEDEAPGYLRLTSLDVFDGETWSQSQLNAPKDQRVSRGLPVPQGMTDQTPTEEVATSVEVLGLGTPWLPVPYPPIDVEVDGDWRYDAPSRTIFSTRTDTRGLVYDVRSLLPEPTAELLRASGPAGSSLDEYRALPRDLPPQVGTLVEELTAGLTSPYDKVLALQSFFRGPESTFAYDESVPQGNSSDALLNFLSVRRGYCEQYAAAMAVMARVAGVPARVAVGFTQGTRSADGTWVITTDDAHSWPEIYFPGAGWLQFEPTPLTDGTGVTPSWAQFTGGPTPTGPGTPASPLAPGLGGPPNATTSSQLDRIERLINEKLDDTIEPGTDPFAVGSPAERGSVLVGLGLIAAVLLAAPGVGRWVTRRRRRRTATDPRLAAAAAWSEVTDDATDVGLPASLTDSPRAAARRIAERARMTPESADALRRIALAEERGRYAASPDEDGDFAADLHTVRAALRGSVSRRQQWQARLMPASTLRRTSSAVADQTADLLDRIDAADAWLRSRTRRPASQQPG